MLVHQAFRYELAPTPAQRAALNNHAGAARWAWNWGLAVRRKAWQRGGPPRPGHRYRAGGRRGPGIRTFAVCSDGTRIDGPRALTRYHRRIRTQRVDALHTAHHGTAE